jgi:antitoxin ParD1/3/4
MTSLNISLPKSMRAFVDEQVSAGGYSTASEYVRQLIREAQKSNARSSLQSAILEGINSGDSTEWTQDDWDDIDSELEKRLNGFAHR